MLLRGLPTGWDDIVVGEPDFLCDMLASVYCDFEGSPGVFGCE